MSADQPSAPQLAELEQLRAKRDDTRRAAQAWQMIVSASGNSDFGVVLDYAVEHGLALSLGSAAQSGVVAVNALWRNPADGSEMVWVPPGPFVVGSAKEPAECGGFSLARHPVTNEQFLKFVAKTGYEPHPEHESQVEFPPFWALGAVPKGKEKHPVVWVSLLDALAYCDWAGLTLPTEWLWEKAARGPDGRKFPWGDEHYPLKKLANVHATATVPVGSFPRTRSAYGCEDLVGNVSEWCVPIEGADRGAFPAARYDPKPPTDGSVLYAPVRGSCFLRTDPGGMHASHRRRLSIHRRNRWVGFRPAALLPCRPAR